jgi:hypothetical protein
MDAYRTTGITTAVPIGTGVRDLLLFIGHSPKAIA